MQDYYILLICIHSLSYFISWFEMCSLYCGVRPMILNSSLLFVNQPNFFMKVPHMLSRYTSSFPYLLNSISMYVLFSWLIHFALFYSYNIIPLFLDLGKIHFIYISRLFLVKLTLFFFIGALNMLLRYVLSLLWLLVLWVHMACLSVLWLCLNYYFVYIPWFSVSIDL